MSTKKVKNSSQSGKANKGFGAGAKLVLEPETQAAVAVVAESLKKIDEALEVVATDASASLDDAINPDTDVDFSFGRVKVHGNQPKPPRSERDRSNYYKDEPIVYIAGEKRELTKLDSVPKRPGYSHYYRESNNPIELRDQPGQRFHPDALLTKEPISWYHVSLPEIDLYVTQGSEVTIDERVMRNCGWEGDDGWVTPEEGKKPELYVICSTLKCRSISIGSSLDVNNSFLETTGHIDGVCAKVIGSRINIKDNIDLYSSSLYNCCIEGSNRLMVRNSRYMRLFNLSGFDNINLDKVSCNGTFRINCGWQSVPGLSLDIKDICLVEFAAQFYNFNTLFAKEYGDAKPWQGNGMVIRRRTDYGYFSAAQPIPFVRCGDYNIATTSNLYLAKEIDHVSFPKEKAPLAYQPQFGGFRSDYQPPMSMEDNSYTMGLRGGKLWEKARKDCFNNPNRTDDKRPIGMIGDNLIQSLVDQIKSRIKLYVELAVITEV